MSAWAEPAVNPRERTAAVRTTATRQVVFLIVSPVHLGSGGDPCGHKSAGSCRVLEAKRSLINVQVCPLHVSAVSARPRPSPEPWRGSGGLPRSDPRTGDQGRGQGWTGGSALCVLRERVGDMTICSSHSTAYGPKGPIVFPNRANLSRYHRLRRLPQSRGDSTGLEKAPGKGNRPNPIRVRSVRGSPWRSRWRRRRDLNPRQGLT